MSISRRDAFNHGDPECPSITDNDFRLEDSRIAARLTDDDIGETESSYVRVLWMLDNPHSKSMSGSGASHRGNIGVIPTTVSKCCFPFAHSKIIYILQGSEDRASTPSILRRDVHSLHEERYDCQSHALNRSNSPLSVHYQERLPSAFECFRCIGSMQ